MLLRLLLALPLLAVLAAFALSNPQPIRLGLWPTPWSIEAPISLAILAALGAGVLIGALIFWAAGLADRRRARRAERARDALETELRRLRANPAAPEPAPLATRLPPPA